MSLSFPTLRLDPVPSGHAEPSAADRALTKRLARTLDALDVQLADHFILAGERITSFRALGLL